MAEQIAYPLGKHITCHAWNADFSYVAVCLGDNDLIIYRASLLDGDEWQKEATLQKHEEVISGVDWCHKNDRIVTCSYDRNAYVWERVDGQWQPALVILRLERAALCVSWSRSGRKFAVGSGSRSVSVCYYDADNRWWVSKAIKKKHSSSVTSLAWHPNNALLATTSTDCKCRIFCVPIRSVDGSEAEKGGGGGEGGSQQEEKEKHQGFSIGKFGEQLLQLDLSFGWTYGAAWSPSGLNLAFLGHDSTIHFANNVGPNLTIHSLSLSSLPLRDALFLSDRLLVAAGFQGNPMLFAADAQGRWSFLRFLDESQSQASMTASKSSSIHPTSSPSSSSSDLTDPSHTSTHTLMLSLSHHPPSVAGAVTGIRAMQPSSRRLIEMFSTCGFDGRVVVWDVSGLHLASALRRP